MLENFEIVWSNNKNWIPIRSLSYEERQKFRLLGWTNKFNDFCYRLKGTDVKFIGEVSPSISSEASIWKYKQEYYWLEKGFIKMSDNSKKEEIKKEPTKTGVWETLFNFINWL